MKNITATIIALAMLLGMASCNGGTDVPAGTTAGSTTAETTAAAQTTELAQTTASVTTEATEEVTTSDGVSEAFDAETFLATIPVYEYSYEENKFLDCFDKIGGAEYNKYIAGEKFDEFYAIKFIEYPDIAIIGQVVTESDKEDAYHQRLLNSVIRKGERYYLTENKNGPGFHAYITNDFLCITIAASGIGRAFYVYDGGSEYHTSSNIVDEGQLSYLYEEDGIMKYMIYSKKYAGMRHSDAPLLSADLNEDDHFYDKGTVKLIDGRIEYVADVSYTVGEWFESEEGPKEKTGCNTLEEYSEWLRNELDSMSN